MRKAFSNVAVSKDKFGLNLEFLKSLPLKGIYG